MTVSFNDDEFMAALQQFEGLVHSTGDQVAAELQADMPEGVNVDVENKRDHNGRPVSVVTIAHASGMARQAKDGVLTRKAASLGMDVVRY